MRNKIIVWRPDGIGVEIPYNPALIDHPDHRVTLGDAIVEAVRLGLGLGIHEVKRPGEADATLPAPTAPRDK